MHRLSWLITLPLIALAVCFAVGNREPVIVNLWPLGYEVALPIYMLALVPLAIGLVLGGLVIWFGGLRHKLQARKLAREVGKLRDQVGDLQTKLESRAAATDPGHAPPLLSRWRQALPWT
ncbi:MAG: DUF1049 domain-containing protein [Alphaproteobacteria bacterium]|nr:DUF1049 domain-containing protein [Alphaproteobacteria bacterium]